MCTLFVDLASLNTSTNRWEGHRPAERTRHVSPREDPPLGDAQYPVAGDRTTDVGLLAECGLVIRRRRIAFIVVFLARREPWNKGCRIQNTTKVFPRPFGEGSFIGGWRRMSYMSPITSDRDFVIP